MEFPRYERSGRWLFVAWLIAGCAMLAAAIQVPQTRTQEARVLAGAREMLGQPLERWLIPQANGEPRLRKPPLAYWLSAGSYEVFGFSVTAGRLPAVVAAWLTLALTYQLGKRLFDPRAGFLGAACMMGTLLFFKFGSLAETDVIVMFGVTLGTFAIWEANRHLERNDHRGVRKWLCAVAVCVAMAALTKGPPAGYLLILMGLLDVTARRRRGLVWNFIAGPAVVIALILVTPWFVYAFLNADGGQLVDDLSNSARGGLGHSGYFWAYFPMLMQAAAPWTIVWIVACIASLRVVIAYRGQHTSLNFVYCWGIAVLVPLLFWGNKQIHYLLPLMPAIALSVGWLLSPASPDVWRRAGRVAMIVTVCAILIAIPGVLGYGLHVGHVFTSADWATTAALAVLFGVTLVCVHFGRGIELSTAVASAVAVAMVIVKGGWLPTVEPPGLVVAVKELREKFPDARFVFRNEASLPMCVAFGEVIEVMSDLQFEEVRADSHSLDRIVCLDVQRHEAAPPDRFEVAMVITAGDNVVTASVGDGSRWDPDGKRDFPVAATDFPR